MLQRAFSYKNELNRMFTSIVDNPDYKFFTSWPTWNLTLGVDDSTSEKQQFVSIDNGQKILGYMSASVSYPTRSVRNIALISFEKIKYNSTFMRDFHEFFIRLFYHYNYSKVRWSVSCGSPHEKVYEKICKKYGGRIVGLFKNENMLYDGSIHDEKWFEILREEFIKSTKNTKRVQKIIGEIKHD